MDPASPVDRLWLIPNFPSRRASARKRTAFPSTFIRSQNGVDSGCVLVGGAAPGRRRGRNQRCIDVA